MALGTANVPSFPQGQKFDLLIRGGRVIDPRNGIDAQRDVAIAQGKIARVAERIPESDAMRIADASGLIVTPGLIDMHAHVFYGTDANAYLSSGTHAVAPDGFTFRVGVTTVVDAGGPGWRNFEQFKAQVIDRSLTRVLSLLNIVGAGMRGGPAEQNLADMDAERTAKCALQFPGTIVGIKVAHYQGAEWDPVDRAVNAGKIAGIPVMIDFGGHVPELSLCSLLLEHLRPGDMFTHVYAHVKGRQPVVDEQGKVRPCVFDAQKRGIILDVGHGGGSFLFRQAVPAMRQGLAPDTISTDLHTGSMNAGMKDMLNVMSKFLNLGMSLPEVIRKSSWKPAQVIKKPELGHLSEGAPADVTVLRLREGEFGFVDTGGGKMPGRMKLECELTMREGKVVYDANGISFPLWEKKADHR
ncbi:MAG: amidohydrolase/deacetylase family metallohydrolase [Acidobacteria bacterium]|nr:amidohydrolase/deacetylase family metallohydrolase [Acidobacteriota bacterium]